MKKEEVLGKVEDCIRLMVNGFVFDIKHIYGATFWLSYGKKDKEAIASLFLELVQNEFKDMVIIEEANADLSVQKYKKIGEATIEEPENVFPDEPVKINRGSRGNA